MPTDQELVQFALRGDREAAESLLLRHQPTLQRIANSQVRRIFDGEVDADDVMQEFYFKVCRNGYRALACWRGLTDPTQPGIEPYFKEMLRNVVHDFARGVYTRRSREEDVGDEGLDNIVGTDDCGEDDLAREQLYTAVQECIGTVLNAGQREVIRLYLEGRSPAEIAGILRIEPGNARVRLHRALEALRRALASRRNDWEPGGV